MKNLEIKDLAYNLALNSSMSCVCPFCYAEHEKSFRITRVPAGLVYFCHRAKCGRHGIVGEVIPTHQLTAKKQFEPKKVEHDLVELPQEIYDQHLVKYEVPLSMYHHCGVRYTPDVNALYCPIFNLYGGYIGEILKYLDKDKSPKTRHFKGYDTPFIYLPPMQLFQPGDSLVIVEDWISAIKLGTNHYNAAAICGTHLSDEMLKQIKRVGVNNLIVMLDGNAHKVAIHLINRVGPFFENATAIFIPEDKDPKDLSFDELSNLIEEVL